MPRYSVSVRFESFFAAATLAAHVSCQGSGFRQKNVLFLIELFANWVETSSAGHRPEIQITQIGRYLAHLDGEGYVRKKGRSSPATFVVTRTGILELLNCIASRQYIDQRGYFFFFYYFLKNYRYLFEYLVEQDGKLFSPALRLELEALLDSNAFVKREIEAAKKELNRLTLRIADSKATSTLTRQRLEQGEPFSSVVEEIKKRYPYELNSQKPIDELLGELPADLQRWEMESGSHLRVSEIWHPARIMLESYIEQLRALYKAEQ